MITSIAAVVTTPEAFILQKREADPYAGMLGLLGMVDIKASQARNEPGRVGQVSELLKGVFKVDLGKVAINEFGDDTCTDNEFAGNKRTTLFLYTVDFGKQPYTPKSGIVEINKSNRELTRRRNEITPFTAYILRQVLAGKKRIAFFANRSWSTDGMHDPTRIAPWL